MSVLSKTELTPSVKDQVDLTKWQAEICAEVMSNSVDRPNRIYDWAEVDPRLSSAAAFIIEAADFVDSVDHCTSDEKGGTDQIQELALEVRELVRDYMAEVKEVL